VFFSLGISWGGIIMLGSYNKFNARQETLALVILFFYELSKTVSGIWPNFFSI
jgi:hypothetical protein